jgi:anti-sigma B factor antagonist
MDEPNRTSRAMRSPRGGRIDVECLAGVCVLTLHGEHDVSTHSALREQLEYVGQAGGPIVVDMSPAEFIDSTVIGALARHRRQADNAGAFALVAPSSYQGSHLVEVIGIGTVIPVYPTRAQAIAALTNR